MAQVTITLLSDTHELHREADVPYADLLIHAGDFTMMSRSRSAIRDFDRWLGELPHPHRVICPGNHDFYLENPSKRKSISNAYLLVNEGVRVLGLKIWGSPTTPLGDAAFGLSSEADRAKLYSMIPSDTDILITHGPPYGILDRAPDSSHHAGCRQLLAAVRRIKPRLHVFGHVHGAFGMIESPQTLFVNSALLGLEGSLEHDPVTLKIASR